MNHAHILLLPIILAALAAHAADQAAIWALGHPDDNKVAPTLLRTGNFDFVSKQTQWDSNIPNHTLPASLYLTSKPAFLGKLPWPLFGPDANPMISSLPARERFLKIPKAEHEAQDQCYLGEYLIAENNAADGNAALQQVVAKYAGSSWALRAKGILEGK